MVPPDYVWADGKLAEIKVNPTEEMSLTHNVANLLRERERRPEDRTSKVGIMNAAATEINAEACIEAIHIQIQKDNTRSFQGGFHV